MILQNTYNGKCTEYSVITDIYENGISNKKLNSTAFERHLMAINVGKKRRLRNNHAQRLAQFKLK